MNKKVSKVTLEVCDPTGPFELTELHAPRLDSLAGKTICELSNGKWEQDRTFALIRELLQKRYPDARIVPYTEFPEGTNEIQDESITDLVRKKGCQAVITGNAG